MSKSPWTKPKLIVIARSNPEEAVLAACKTGLVGAGPGTKHGRCIGDSRICSDKPCSKHATT